MLFLTLFQPAPSRPLHCLFQVGTAPPFLVITCPPTQLLRLHVPSPTPSNCLTSHLTEGSDPKAPVASQEGGHSVDGAP
jgi:hypothetical protein